MMKWGERRGSGQDQQVEWELELGTEILSPTNLMDFFFLRCEERESGGDQSKSAEDKYD